jgi:glycerophosphoryl diester phosphodiesterase
VHNPWIERRVLCVAHQGGAAEAPASTFFAMDLALAAGADMLELDVHRSRDGVLIVNHDATLERSTGVPGRIEELTAAQICALDGAFNFVPDEGLAPGREPAEYPLRGRATTDATLHPVTLDALLERYPGVLLNLDIKAGEPESVAYEADLAALLRAHGRSDDVIVASFLDARLERFRALAPEFATAAGTNAMTGFFQAVRQGMQPHPDIRRHAALQMPYRVGSVVLVDERLVDVAHRQGVALHVWTVDDEAEMEHCVDMGVDALMSDRPRVLAGLLSSLGANYRRPGASN